MKVKALPVVLWLLALHVSIPAEGQIVVKLGTIAPEGSTWHDVLLKMREEWRRLSEGGVELRIYAGGVLGDEGEMVRKVQRRSLDAVAVSGPGLSRIDDGVDSLHYPMFFESYEELDYVRDRLAPKLEARIEARNFKVLNWSDAGWVYFFTREPARSPEDVRGMKLWTSAGDPDTEKAFKDLGFQVVPLPATDMLTSLQTGLIDAFDVPPLFALLDRSYQVANHMIDLKWAPVVAATVVSTRAWDQIPAELRPKLLEVSRKAGEELRAEIRKAHEDAIAEMKNRGLLVVELDERERALWRAEVEAAMPTLRELLGPPDLHEEAKRYRDEYRSANSR
ncbi:MAG TPA: TRAP transporter substrate-binding protein DctP [Vicinamibacteria bacterium]|nr:TRAP transporter substrate-binding protein DctP [Vicinamibacteria bacterium]